MNQQEYEERMKDPRYRELEVTNCKSGKEYVFISYRGDSWKQMLDIVYRLQKKHGLRIYFDKAFASKTNVWIDQFRKNMDSTDCKAVLCFFDEGYVTSYATLLELMHAMNPKSQLSNSIYAINFPIDWETLKKRDYTTGLGEEGSDNPAWKEELKAFKHEFELLQERNDYKDIKAYFDSEDTSQELRVCDCSRIMKILQPKDRRQYVDTEAFYEQFIVQPIKEVYPGVFAEEQVDNNIVESDFEPRTESKEGNEPPKTEGYTYTIFGKEYKAQKQGQLMYDAVVALTERHPDKAEALTAKTSISRAEEVTDANTQSAQPVYFRICQKYKVGETEYYVGMSYGFDAKIAEIKGMFQICGEDVSQFILNGKPLESKKKIIQAGSGDGKMTEETPNGAVQEKADDIISTASTGYTYTIFGKEYKAQKQGQLMYDAVVALTERHPDKAEALTAKTSISRAEEVTDANTQSAQPVYFRICQKYKVGETEYYVGMSYSFDAKLAEIKGMFQICGEDVSQFVLKETPQPKSKKKMQDGFDGWKKFTHSSNEKEGLGELLID